MHSNIHFKHFPPPLPAGPNQIDTFLAEHGGPGVQHIGLYTDDIVSVVDRLQLCGVQFNEPPCTYYSEVSTPSVKFVSYPVTTVIDSSLRCAHFLVTADFIMTAIFLKWCLKPNFSRAIKTNDTHT